ncbi:MAG: SagB/ThcOx family dehydrogenase [Planctomycetes bacterium]|nr:SagB/ThcOx family dehydrogenase [Planctomycetota bacterium]
MKSPAGVALSYHERTKHRVERPARSLGYLDWQTQPDPFRGFAGAPFLALPEVEPGDQPALDALGAAARPAPAPLDARSLGQLFYDSFAISAWKELQDSRWALRCNPSSGNLHPTEAYLLCGAAAGLAEEPALYHYSPLHHGLELRRTFHAAAWARFLSGLPAGSFLVALTSIHWREAWKYGERAYRYCQLDAGHAIAALSFAAAPLGWTVRLVSALSERETSELLRVSEQNGVEAEHPDCLLAVMPAAGKGAAACADSWRPAAAWRKGLVNEDLPGTPNPLSSGHHPWPVIEEVAEACRAEPREDEAAPWVPPEETCASPAGSNAAARRVFRTRRSAVQMDGQSTLARGAFARILHRLLPAAGAVPCGALPWRPAVHALLFVHRVVGLDPGLYLLVREAGAEASLRAALSRDFAWERAAGETRALPLFRLASGDLRDAARSLSCHQDIAADGAFAVAMLAEFEPRIREAGAWFYRALYWEAGVLGQALYLEAEAAGLRGTGIGCFFDDALHQLAGIRDRGFQTLYHFTVGGALEDPRLRTLPAYAREAAS